MDESLVNFSMPMDDYMDMLHKALSLHDLRPKREPIKCKWDILAIKPKKCHKPVNCHVEIIEE